MSLLEHLVELRNRLMWAVLAFGIAFGVCYYFAPHIFAFLMAPLAHIFEGQTGRRMIFTGLTEAFFTYVKVAFWAAAMVSFPVIATQIWIFIAPGLYKNERKAFAPFLAATPILFLLGASLVYFFIIPLAWKFFVGFETPGVDGSLPIQLEAKLNEYLSLVMTLIFAFGLSFELPVLLTLLARVGIVSSAMLKSKRRFAIVGVFVFAAVVTPPDVISQVGLAIPLMALYELSILSVKHVEKQRAEREAERDADLDS